jgi:hypothetical protein
MKKSLLISTTLVVLALSATSIYAQVSGSSLITKMKAAAANFTLASELNPGQTGLQSAPVSGKKTGDILTAGEWNRVLELLGEGTSGGSGNSGSGWENVPLTDTNPFNQQCMYRVVMQWQTYYLETIHENRAYWIYNMYFEKANKSALVGGIAPVNVATKMEKLCGGGSGGSGSGWENVPLTDTADYDTTCLYEVNIKTTAALHNNLMNGDTSWRTGTARTNKYLWLAFTDWSATTYASWWVPSSSKSTYGYRDSVGTFVPTSGVSILWMRKICGGGGSGGTSNITWANFDGSGSVAIKWSNGITSIVRESAGNYRVTFATPRPNTDYGVICTSGPSPSYLCFPNDKSTTSFLIKTSNPTNNVDAAFVSLIITPFDVWTSSGGSSRAFYYCTNAQSLDSSNAPCYGAAQNDGSGNGRYRAVVATHLVWGGKYSNAIFFFSGTKWSCAQTGVGIYDCIDGSVLVVDTQASWGGSGYRWVDVPTDGADFDTSCEYRYDANYLADDANRKWMNATSATVYIEGVSTKYLRRDLDLANNVMWGIQSSDKTKYGNRNSSGVFTVANNIQITRLQKKCD